MQAGEILTGDLIARPRFLREASTHWVWEGSLAKGGTRVSSSAATEFLLTIHGKQRNCSRIRCIGDRWDWLFRCAITD
jgi:hypothetical protein